MSANDTMNTLIGSIRRLAKQAKAALLPTYELEYIRTEDRDIALTFDDGPLMPYTRDILDILKKERVPATFFVQGKHASKEPALLIRMIREGHTIGNHTYSHPDLTGLGESEIAQELCKADDAILQATGIHTRLFRPPYLATNETVRRVARRLGYLTVFSSLDPVTWNDRLPLFQLERTIAAAAPGTILLLHDGVETHPRKSFNRSQTVRNLTPLIRGLKRRGFSFALPPLSPYRY